MEPPSSDLFRSSFKDTPFSSTHQITDDRVVGITFSTDELADLYHFWQYMAYLLGIEERFFNDITDQQHAQSVLALIDNTAEGANEDSRALVHAMLEAISGILKRNNNLPPSVTFNLISALTRHLHGNKLADQLGIKKTWMSILIPIITLINRIQRAWNSRSGTARQKAIARTVKIFLQSPPLEGTTTYQHNANNALQQNLPQTVGN